MTLVDAARPPSRATATRHVRHAWADNLKVALVTGVIVGHATMAWTGFGNWVVFESPVREPLLTILIMLAAVGGLCAVPLLFMVAGVFTPPALQRKGLRRFLADRVVRLGAPVVFFVAFLAPIVEFADADNAGWDRGFVAFVAVNWREVPPTWGPLWFLVVLLVFSTVYALLRTLRPRDAVRPLAVRGRQLAAMGLVVALGSYAIRIWIPLAEEVFRLALAQSPAWIACFVLGVVGAERGWYEQQRPRMARALRRVAWGFVAAIVAVLGVAGMTGSDLEVFAGGGTWQSLLVAVLEAGVIVSLPFWVMDLFRRRWDHQGRVAAVLSRGAFAAYIIHQLVLVGAVLATRQVPWVPEAEWAAASAVAVAVSFGIGALAARVPGVSRVV